MTTGEDPSNEIPEDHALKQLLSDVAFNDALAPRTAVEALGVLQRLPRRQRHFRLQMKCLLMTPFNFRKSGAIIS